MHDYDKIKDMKYDPARKRFIGKDGSELKVTPYSNGNGYKYDYYPSSTYGNASHNSTHIKSDLNQNWKRTDNNRSNGNNSQSHSSGSGCYLTTACMSHFQENFDDNGYELTVLRWFRDNFVPKEDIEYYYNTAPRIVEAIDQEEKKDVIYDYIYDSIVDYCVKQIENGNYNEAYNRYKSSIICFEKQFVKTSLEQANMKTLKKVKKELFQN